MTNKQCILALVLILVGGIGMADEKYQARIFKFNKEDVDKTPSGWKVAQTGKGEGSVWQVKIDESAPSKTGHVLAQLAKSPSNVFNICIADGTSYKDVEAKVEFKANEGEKDQGGGLVWRYKDADNYYIARFNPLEDNFRVYKVVAGKRIQLETKEGVKAEAGKWHTLAIKMTGDSIECSLNGTKHLEAKDNTFAEAGQVGLWSKADARTSFDSFQVTALKK